ncbi:MAG: glycolate oxidase FAD binding subunit [Paracoccaceae bacterium]|jgi:glycolate oxidase FAD binding subunit
MQPQNEAELSLILATATEPLDIIGGGTRTLFDATESVKPLYTNGFSGVQLYEPGALTLVAGSGTLVEDVAALLTSEKQRLPFEVPDYAAVLGRKGHSTLGGVVATNASGPRRVQAGACRDSMIGVRFIDGAGNIVKNGGRVMKNVTGLDLVKLLAGSYGTLGVLTEVGFKLLPAPESSRTLHFVGFNAAEAVVAMAAGLGSPFEVTGAAYVPERGTFLRIEGFEVAVVYRAAALQKHLMRFGSSEILIDAEQVWRDIRDLTPFVGKKGDLWRLSVKPSDAPEITEKLAPLQLILDWGGGLLWALMPENTDLRTILGKLNGHATLFRGKGGGAPIFQPESMEVATLTRGLRAKFDPKNILNSGRMA